MSLGIYKRPRREPAWLAPAIWRVIIFQLWAVFLLPVELDLDLIIDFSTFVLIQFLAFVTIFSDLVVRNRRSPSPFGTQHVALLLTAWCPVFIFGVCFDSVVWQLVLMFDDLQDHFGWFDETYSHGVHFVIHDACRASVSQLNYEPLLWCTHTWHVN